jgi:hypothetical protein
MRKYILIVFVMFITASNTLLAQEQSYDELHLKNIGVIKGKVMSIGESTVEFRADSNYMYYTYPKKDIDFIVLSTGEWVTFENGRTSINRNYETSWGYLNLSGGGIQNEKPLDEAAVRKRGFSFSADLNYQIGRAFSTGFQVGYNQTEVNSNVYLLQNGYSGLNSSLSGGTSYLLSIGSINRIYIFPNSSIKPVISFFAGYGNLLISRSEIISPSRNQQISDLSKDGLLAGAGAALFIDTGTRSGIMIGSRYNWLIYKKENIEFITFNIGYVIPIN